jgi:thiamine biosynthesis lipoprotein
MKRRTFIAAAIGSVGSAAGVCAHSAGEPPRQLMTGTTRAFGRSVRVTVAHADQGIAAQAIADALLALRSVDQLMSLGSKEGQVFRLNRDGWLDTPHANLLAVLKQARALSILTRGAFDITVQPLWRVFGAAAAVHALPYETARLLAHSRVNWQRLRVSSARVAFADPGMAITLDSLAPGYGADLAMAALKAYGVDHALLDTGEFGVRGGPWTPEVADPREPGLYAARLRLDGRCVATSADYAGAFTPDLLHHHVIDPVSGWSPRELASVTVAAPTAMLADGLSTACMVLGARKAHALVSRLAGVDILTINKRGVVWKSRGFPCL